MTYEILENTPRSLKLHSSNRIGFFVGLFFVAILFLISGSFLVLSLLHLGEQGFIPAVVSLFFTLLFWWWVRGILLSAHTGTLHFDQTITKLNLDRQAIFQKLPAVEIPFAQLDKIEFNEKFHINDNDEEHSTYSLDLKTKDKLALTTTTWFSLWSSAAESQRHEVEEMARLVSEITGIPYTFSTNKKVESAPEKVVLTKNQVIGKTEILENTPQSLTLFWLSGKDFSSLIKVLFLTMPVLFIVSVWAIALLPITSTLNCERLEPTHINCTLQNSNPLGLMREDYRLEKLQGVRIVTEEHQSEDGSYTIYSVLVRARQGDELFYRTRDDDEAHGTHQEIEAFIANPTQMSLHLKKSENNENVILAVAGVLVGAFGILKIYIYFFSRYAYTLHFDPAIRKLRLQPHVRWKMPRAQEIPFDHIERIKFEDKTKKEDDNKFRIYSLKFEIKGKGFLSATPQWASLCENVRKPQRGEVEELARLIAEITGIPYTFSTDKPLPKNP